MASIKSFIPRLGRAIASLPHWPGVPPRVNRLLSAYSAAEAADILEVAADEAYCRLLDYLSRQDEVRFEDCLAADSVRISLSQRQIDEIQPLLKSIFQDRLRPLNDDGAVASDFTLLWGAKFGKIERLALQARQSGGPVGFIEDGYLRSVLGGLHQDEPRYLLSYSLIFDDLAPHYDGRHQSRLERIILNSGELSGPQLDRATNFIHFLRTHSLTKYNNQPPAHSLSIGGNPHKVLIVLQSYGDASVRVTGGGEHSFQKMLHDALTENPGSDILIKAHPDTLVKRNKKYLEAQANVHYLDFEINPLSLMAYVDKVYVYSSQAGFEALLLGREAVVYGRPWYAGWGLTDDRAPQPRRLVSRTLPQLVQAMYFDYSLYFDPESGSRIKAEEAAGRLLELRREYFQQKRHSRKVLIIKLDGIGDHLIFRNYIRYLKESPFYADAEFTLLGDTGYQEIAELLDADFFKDFIWVNRRANRLLSLLIEQIQKRGSGPAGRLLGFLKRKYLDFLFAGVPKDKYDCVIVFCWSHMLQQQVINPLVRRLKAASKIGRAVYARGPACQNDTFNYLVPVPTPEYTQFRGRMEKTFLENIIGRDIPEPEFPTLPAPESTDGPPYVLIFTGAYNRTRCWPTARYADLAEMIIKKYGLRVLLGGALFLGEKKPRRVEGLTDLTGRRPMKELMARAAGAELIICNDTSFYHLAVALGRKTIVLSNGNSYHSFLRYPHVGDVEYILSPDFLEIMNSGDQKRFVRNIINSGCDINTITVETVMAAVDRALAERT